MSDDEIRGLAELAERINREHDAVGARSHDGLAHAVEAGRLLTEAKARVVHGGWLPWLREHCRISARTAQGYMRVARHAAELGAGDPRRDVALSFRQAMDLAARPKFDETPLAARAWVRAAGEELTRAEFEDDIEARAAKIIESGRAMAEAKALVGPDRFESWLDGAFGDSADMRELKLALHAVERGITEPKRLLALTWGSRRHHPRA